MTYYFTYRITDLNPPTSKKYYYGYTKCNCRPIDYIGKKYFSSSTDKNFIKRQKYSPENFKYKIIKIFDNKYDALELEIKLHNKFNVGKNPLFYNKAKQTSKGFDTTGKVTVRDENGVAFLVDIDDQRLENGELKYVSQDEFTVFDKIQNKKIRINKENYNPNIHIMHNKGSVTVKDENGKYHWVDKNDPRIENGELVGNRKGYVSVKDKNDCTMSVSVDNYEYKSGKLNHIFKDTVVVKDEDGNKIQIKKNDQRYINGELIYQHTNTVVVKDKNGNTFRVSKDDPRYLSGELIGHTKGMTAAKDENGKYHWIDKNDPRLENGDLVGNQKGKVTVKNVNGETMSVSLDDPRYLSGELKHITKDVKRIWIKNIELQKCKFVLNKELDLWLDKGWVRGRIKNQKK